MTDQPQTTEPVPVQLTRIEGVVNLIAYQMTEAKADINGIRGDMHALAVRVTAVEMAQAATGDVDAIDKRLSAIEHIQAAAAGASGWLKSWLPTIIALSGLAVALGFGVKFGG